jgi:di/tricarboxylate transporter
VIGTILIVVATGDRLLPERQPRRMPADFSEHARTLVAHYDLDDAASTLLTRRSGVAEVIVPPRSDLAGRDVFPGMVTDSGDLVVRAVHRDGENLGPEPMALEAGDALLLEGTWSALAEHLDDPDVVVVHDPDAVRRQAVPLGPGAKRAIAVLVVMVVLLATGAVPPAVAGLLAAGALVLLGVVTIDQAYRGISWTTVILVAGMIPLSGAMIETGAAQRLADGLVDVVGDAGPRVLLLAVALLTVALGQLISNTATALIVIPVAVSAGDEVGVSPEPVLMAVAVAAAASFLTPVATPANLMVMGPGGYRFGDYWKLGLPLAALFVAVAVLLVPVIWSF